MLRTTIIEDVSGFQHLRPLWEELHSYQRVTMFQSFVWNETATRVFASREKVHTVVVKNEQGAAIVPVCLREANLGLIGEKLFDYRDALCSDASLLHTALGVLGNLGMPFSATALRGEDTLARWKGVPIRPFASAPAVLRRSVTADEFLRTHNRLARHSRRVRKQGIALHLRSGSNRVLVRTIYEQKATQGEAASNLFSDALRREFMVEICSHPEVPCDVYTYETTADIVAALVTFRDGAVRRFYTVYYDQRWASLSPGQVLLFEITAQSLAEGLDCDYMTGEYPYKLRLATDIIPLHRVTASPQELRDAARKNIAHNTLAA